MFLCYIIISATVILLILKREVKLFAAKLLQMHYVDDGFSIFNANTENCFAEL